MTTVEVKCRFCQQTEFVKKHSKGDAERENLTLRTRIKRLNRKTRGYSKSPEIYDKVIGTFIEREYYV
ncbi:IS1 family transposase [Xenorhabdus griffiniae]|uniref:IS1 family transposase n=1 Tax=Xenorhabdus griffiniae TaxID=351672 RepID=UPI0021D52319|nr:IS1 family transposase [Xenorhabdus griffiniae]